MLCTYYKIQKSSIELNKKHENILHIAVKVKLVNDAVCHAETISLNCINKINQADRKIIEAVLHTYIFPYM